MSLIRRILVAVKDPQSPALMSSITKAAQLARAMGANIELFHAITTQLYAGDSIANKRLLEAEQSLRNRHLSALETLAVRVRQTGVEVAVAAEFGARPYEAIIAEAQRIRADLIVAQSHPTRALAAMLMHLNDRELLHHSPIPVLLVRTPANYHRPIVLAAVDVARSQTELATLRQHILGTSAAVASALRGTLHAVHAHASTGGAADRIFGGFNDVLSRQTADRVRVAFEKAVQPLRIPNTQMHLMTERPVAAIRRAVRAIDSTIVVLGAVANTGLQQMFGGNTAERLLNRLTCDVLVVKTPILPQCAPQPAVRVTTLAGPTPLVLSAK